MPSKIWQKACSFFISPLQTHCIYAILLAVNIICGFTQAVERGVTRNLLSRAYFVLCIYYFYFIFADLLKWLKEVAKLKTTQGVIFNK